MSSRPTNTCDHCSPQPPARMLDPSKENAASRVAAAPFAVTPIDETERRNRIERLKKLLEERIVFLDGAMGTMIQQHQLDERGYRGERFRNHGRDLKGNNDILSLTQPDIVADIHRSYLQAGSDIIETNTFSSTAIAQADYNMQSLAYELNVAAAKIARQAIEEFTAANRQPSTPLLPLHHETAPCVTTTLRSPPEDAAMPTRYYLRLTDPANARGKDPDLAFRSSGAGGVRKTTLSRWAAMRARLR